MTDFTLRETSHLIIVLILSLVLSFSAHAQKNIEREELVRAAIIVSMLRFTSWEMRQDSSSDRLKLCAYGNPRSLNRLSLATQNTPGIGKNLELINITGPFHFDSCDVLIVGEDAKYIFKETPKNTLTFCDGCVVNQNELIVNLYIKNKKIVFDINLQSAETARIRLSSDVLVLANSVKRGASDE